MEGYNYVCLVDENYENVYNGDKISLLHKFDKLSDLVVFIEDNKNTDYKLNVKYKIHRVNLNLGTRVCELEKELEVYNEC